MAFVSEMDWTVPALQKNPPASLLICDSLHKKLTPEPQFGNEYRAVLWYATGTLQVFSVHVPPKPVKSLGEAA